MIPKSKTFKVRSVSFFDSSISSLSKSKQIKIYCLISLINKKLKNSIKYLMVCLLSKLLTQIRCIKFTYLYLENIDLSIFIEQ